MKKPTQKQIAEKLGVTQQMVSKMVKAGMPMTSIAAAQKWVRSKAEESRTAPEPGTLTEGRLRKILLECALLQARIDRELDTSTLMPTSQVESALSFILTMLGHSLTNGAGEVAARVEGVPLVDSYKIIKEAAHGAFLQTLSSYINASTMDPRLKRVAKRVMEQSVYHA